jgi:hypothetical protein
LAASATTDTQGQPRHQCLASRAKQIARHALDAYRMFVERDCNTAARCISLHLARFGERDHIFRMQDVHKPIARSSTTNRSAVTNGSKLLVGIDMRSPTARRFRDLVQAFKAEVGGDLSQTEMAMIKTAASLALSNELRQADLVNGKTVDPDELIRLSSEARRILAVLVEKAGKRKPAVQTLQDYLGASDDRAEE